MRFSGGTTKAGHPASTLIGKNERPPFRVGGSSKAQTSGTGSHKESAEMTAWLRRKDYNPMKAAAEAKKLQQLKARADKFMSSRSISFHQGARPFTGFSPIVRDLSRARHNRSQDDLLADDVACGPETILASYSKGITKDLNKLRSVDAAKDKVMTLVICRDMENSNFACMNGLENAVQQLTVKCTRSIELIR
ncbi:unnamed protein product [Gongylonema pulchrum]|uniref:Ribosomal_L7Ae domain-containing protein n=1 Tax=Gongylonema pulchrum TaxID=637853 RepID=A0A183D1C2_9BILA|nr:unnamed protein product [Gongylonema pulchrum]